MNEVIWNYDLCADLSFVKENVYLENKENVYLLSCLMVCYRKSICKKVEQSKTVLP